VKRLASVLALVVFVIGSVAGEASVPGVRMHSVQDPASQVVLGGVDVFKQGYLLFECLSFKNNGPKTISHLQFQFSYFDGDRKEIGSDLLQRTGDFPTGSGERAPIITELVATTDLGKFRTCQSFTPPKQNVSLITAQVNRVDYSDGTSWVKTSPAPSPSPPPSGGNNGN
jgi:hypothetical protein